MTKIKNFFKMLKDKNNRMWAKFYHPDTRIARHGKWYAIAPLTIILIGAILLAIPGVGFNLGLDFTGGSVIEATNLANRDQAIEARDSVREFLRGEGITSNITTPQTTAGTWGLSVQYQFTHDGDGRCPIGLQIEQRIFAAAPGATVNTTETISASASNDLIFMTIVAIAGALIAILAYMLVRFKFTSGVAAVVGLIHDTFVAIALCIIFRVQINYVFVAAIITVVIYSLNNTIVQFDRIRSKEKSLKSLNNKYDVEQVVDASIKEVFARTMSTTLTTLVPVIVLCALPVPLIREFALPILFGLIAGTFSTIFTTSYLYIRFERYQQQRKKHKAQKVIRQENLVSAE